MTKKKLVALLLVVWYAAVIFFVGCVPEDSLQWSQDGSVGIYSKVGALYLVDGNTGSLTQVEPNESTTFWPAISPDGSVFAYGKIVKVDDFKKALKQFRPERVKLIKEHAEILKRKVLAQKVIGEELPTIGTMHCVSSFGCDRKDDFNNEHVAWVQRYLVENADSQLAEKIGPELIKETKEQELAFCQIVIAPTADPNDRKILASDSQMLWHPRFSPDLKFVSWAADRIGGDIFEAGFDLYVASSDGRTPPVLVESAVAIGSDFRDDSRAIAYLKPEGEDLDEDFVIGLLVERTIIDANARFLVRKVDANESDTDREYILTGSTEDLACVVYKSWMNVLCGASGRIFFTSAEMSLPSSRPYEDEPTVFCCDTVTGTISKLLSSEALDFAEGNCHLFALSQDSRQILLPGSYNSVGIYDIGDYRCILRVLVDEDKSFGSGNLPILAPQWKGPDRISCLVGEESPFIRTDPNTPHRRKEIVVLDTDGKLKQVISKDWPDKLLDFNN